MIVKKLRRELLSVALQTIDFSHEDTGLNESSFRLVTLTDSWVPEHFSFAAYSIKDAREAAENNQIKVWARFFKDTPSGSVQIRAVNMAPTLPKGLSEKIFERYEGQNALGSIEPTRVFFGKSGQSVHRGKHSQVPLLVSGSKFHELGVGIYDIVWRWDYRTLSSKSTDENTVWNEHWIPFEQSMHRIFITVELPKAPWSPYPFSILNEFGNLSPVWSIALFVACQWAHGSQTIEEAGKKIADGLFNCGKFVYNPDSSYCKLVDPTLVGDTPNGKKANQFHLTKVLERIMGGNGYGEKVNCVDCSMIVASLTNVLGGNLRTGKLQHTPDTNYADPEIIVKNRFEIQQIRAIGHEDVTATMSGLESEGRYYFSFHSIAWQAADAENPSFDNPDNLIYDACVQFAANENSGEGQTASGIRLGSNEDASGYRRQLSTAENAGIGACLAQKATVLEIQVV